MPFVYKLSTNPHPEIPDLMQYNNLTNSYGDDNENHTMGMTMKIHSTFTGWPFKN